jgi:hypothetical protein
VTEYATVRALVEGILRSDSGAKQDLGRRFAAHLGLHPGPRGADDGIDGLVEHHGRRIHFQCKLTSEELDVDEARKYYSDLIYHGVDVSILLSGIGFKDTFRARLFGHRGMDEIRIHLLTLRDMFEESPSFVEAVRDLPPLLDMADFAFRER